MARREGVFRRILHAITSSGRKALPGVREPVPSSTSSGPKAPTVGNLRQRAITHIVDTLPLVNVDNVRDRVKYMDVDELRWTIKATPDRLRWKARQDADRLTPANIPMNPWWYK